MARQGTLTTCITCGNSTRVMSNILPHCRDCGRRVWTLNTLERRGACVRCLIIPACTRDYPYTDGTYGQQCQACYDMCPEPQELRDCHPVSVFMQPKPWVRCLPCLPCIPCGRKHRWHLTSGVFF